MAAVFSITGISTLFSGRSYTIIFMASALELAKIVVATFLALHWKNLTWIIRTYFVLAVVVLMLITSAGIFGYLSDAYQGTKSNYEEVDNIIKLNNIKKNFYEKKIKTNEERIDILNRSIDSYRVQRDSLNRTI